jgi:SAM-dependent methyltransferase
MRQQLLSPRFARDNAATVQARLASAQRAMVEAFERRIAQSQISLVDERCPCGAADDTIVAEIDRYGLPLTTVLCAACGCLRTNPYLDDRSLDDFYRTTYQTMYARAPHLETYFANQTGYGVRVRALYEDELPLRASVLEVGCGAGGSLVAFKEQGHYVAGCELSRDLIEFGKSKGVPNLWHGTVEEMPTPLASQRWDLIYLHHVFEHVQSPANSLRSLSRLLAPGGRILTIVPDVTRIDEFVNPNGDALTFFHVAHKFNYTVSCLEVVGHGAGLKASAATPPPSLKTAWSEMPELWMEFRQPAGELTPPRLARGEGDRVLDYLLNTERRHQAGFRVPAATAMENSTNPSPTDREKTRKPVKRIWNWLRRRSDRAA